MHKIKCSKESAQRFIKLFLGIKETPYWFHQTLTFKENLSDECIAKKHLKKLLDSLGRFYPEMASLFVLEYQKRGAIHFHIIFMFFGAQSLSPEKMLEKLNGDIWKRWKKILKNARPDRHANRLTKPAKKGLNYLLKYIRPVEKRQRSRPHWFGIRNSKLIQLNSSPVTKQAINDEFESIFPKWLLFPLRSARPQLPSEFTRRDLKKLKSELDGWERATGKYDWQTFKQRELGTSKKVSDEAYMSFRNRERDEKLKKYYEETRKHFPKDESIEI